MSAEDDNAATRRRFLRTSAAVGIGAMGLVATAANAASKGDDESDAADEQVTPGEDLMQEHGLIERILLIYDDAAGRIDKAAPLDLAQVAKAAGLVRSFVEGYHEQLEEQHVFPRLQKAGRETELVAVLLQQHARGRELTADIIKHARAGGDQKALAQLMRSFQRMYRPHAAREDTVLFPAFRRVMGKGYLELGERFEEEEHKKLGKAGFEGAVVEVAAIEAALGIGELAKLTP